MKTTQQPVVYDHIIAYHLLRRAYTNGYDLYCNINTKHTQKHAFIRKEYVQHTPTLLQSNRVAGSIPKIRFVCIDTRIRFYSATYTDLRLSPFLRGEASVNDQLHTTVSEC